MTTYITGKLSVFTENKNINATVVLTNIQNSVQIKSVSWEQILKEISMEKNTQGQAQIAKAWNDNPAKMLQWIKEDENVKFEIWFQKKGEDWTFQNEYIISRDALEIFEPIHAYNLNIMKQLKQDFANAALRDTTFLVRGK